MKYIDNLQKVRSLDQKLVPFKKAAQVAFPQGGWLKAIRTTLGMTSAQLAERAKLSQPRITQIEKKESSGQLTLTTLQHLASAMDLEFVYGFAPKYSLEEQLKTQAKKIAVKRLNRMQHSMELEKQGVSDKDKAAFLNKIVEELINELPKNFWTS